jgi:UDPglucose 6-dehydrogenase
MSSRIAVVGTGYVGLTTGACLSHLGHQVVCADVVPEKVERLSKGDVPILEAGLDDLVHEGLRAGLLTFVLGAANAVADVEFVYLCVPTPQGEDGAADLTYLEAAAREIGPFLRPEAIVINKSTVPVGSTRVVEQALGRSDVFVVSNPEFLREGSAVNDFLHPDRVVIGADDQGAAIRVAGLYLGLTAPLQVTDPASAETIKYASNAFLATKISFINAIAAVCEAVGADVNDVVLGMGYDKRIGNSALRPGPGWGGSCFVGDETVLARRGDDVRLRTFEALFAEVDATGADGWEVLSWRPGDPTPEFFPVERFTARPYEGDVVDVVTKMGRRLTVTADHPFVTGNGSDDEHLAMTLAGDLDDGHWLPVAQGAPMPVGDVPAWVDVLGAAVTSDVNPGEVIVRLSDAQWHQIEPRLGELSSTRAHDVRRCHTLRLDELDAFGVQRTGGRYGTTTNGTYVPASLPLDDELWRVIGLWLAEGHHTVDGARHRIAWSFHPTDEADLVAAVADYWDQLGVKVTTRRLATTTQVSISSRVLGAWFDHGLEMGRTCYTKRIPDLAWTSSDRNKRALLRGLWDGDGSWSAINRGGSSVLEYGTVSRELADGMLRLLGDLGIMARLKVGRTTKSTVDTYWLCISGAEQIERARFLVPDDDFARIRARALSLKRRIKPTGYRPLSKHASWVRVTGAKRRRFDGTVYSLEVPAAHTVVSSHGLVAHNCFPKDSRALVRIAEDAGYDFDLLKGVITVNEEQFGRVADKITRMAGGSVDGVTVAVWGLTFKARTDDLRDSPSLEIVRRLIERGAVVRAFDPAIPVDHNDRRLDGIEVVADAYAATEGAEVLTVLTEWDEFRWLDYDKVADAMATPRVVDARNLLEKNALTRRGFEFEGIGRS